MAFPFLLESFLDKTTSYEKLETPFLLVAALLLCGAALSGRRRASARRLQPVDANIKIAVLDPVAGNSD
jgi:hypothetical protein